VHASTDVFKGKLSELRILNLVNPVNLAILSESFTGLKDSQDLHENSQILFGPKSERFIENLPR